MLIFLVSAAHIYPTDFEYVIYYKVYSDRYEKFSLFGMGRRKRGQAMRNEMCTVQDFCGLSIAIYKCQLEVTI